MRHTQRFLMALLALLPACSGNGSSGDAGPDAASDSDADSASDTDSDSGGDSDSDSDSDSDTDTEADSGADAGDAAPDGGDAGSDTDSIGEWWHTFYGSSHVDKGLSLVADGSGNLLVAGFSRESWNGPNGESPLHAHSEKDDLFVLKLDASGAYQWHTFYGGDQDEYAEALAIDGSGNLYVAGIALASWNGSSGESPLNPYSGFWDIFVLKLDSNGAYKWHTFYGSGDDDYVNSLAVDGSGNAYLAGDSWASWNGPSGESPLHGFVAPEHDDIVILKLDAGGAYQWHTFYGSGTYDDGNSLAVDGGGNVYVAGDSGDFWNGPGEESPLHAFSGFDDMFVLKLDPSGIYQWHTFYGSSDADFGRSLVIDGSGSLYLLGVSYVPWNGPSGESPLHAHSGDGGTTSANIAILKLGSSGTYEWHTFYGSNESLSNVRSLALDESGYLYGIGESAGAWDGPSGEQPLHGFSGKWDILVLKMTVGGAYQWHAFYGSDGEDTGYSLAVGGNGNVYAAGSSCVSWDGPNGESPINAYSGLEDIVVFKPSQ
jgi:hypothetical protein